jgi:Sulfotransferase family
MDSLVKSPVFLLSLPHSGSTLLRCILDSHPLVHAPDELYLTNLEVKLTAPFAELTMKLLGLGPRELEHMLWDRILHRELTRSAKQTIVEKNPRDLLQWERFKEAWPQARFIFLIRHPGAIYASIEESRGKAKERAAKLREKPPEGEHADLQTAWVNVTANNPTSTLDMVLGRMKRLEEARRDLAGLTIRYEDLITDPEQATRDICGFLDLPWDARMLDYGAFDHGWIWGTYGKRIGAGRVVASRPIPRAEEMPAPLVPACRAWGYL